MQKVEYFTCFLQLVFMTISDDLLLLTHSCHWNIRAVIFKNLYVYSRCVFWDVTLWHLLEIWSSAGSYILIDIIVLCRLLSIQCLTKEGDLEVSHRRYLSLSQLLNQILLSELKNILLLYGESSILLNATFKNTKWLAYKTPAPQRKNNIMMIFLIGFSSFFFFLILSVSWKRGYISTSAQHLVAYCMHILWQFIANKIWINHPKSV